MFICSTKSNGTRFTTNCPVSSMWRNVSLQPPPLALMPRVTIGGSEHMTLKNENGAAFTWPVAERVTTQAIGRGTTVKDRIL